MSRHGAVATAVALALAVGSATVHAESVEQRLGRVEKLVDSRGLLDLFVKVEQLQKEVRELRGMVELQNHRLDEMSARERNLYADLDRRLRGLEVGGVAVQPPAAGAPAAPPAGGGAAPAGGASIAPPAAAQPATEAAPPPQTAEERAAYEKALNYLREGRYAPAMEAFRGFLKEYPRSGYADNAQYWLGEANYVTRNFDAALEEFGKVVNDYPNSTKVADALLKVGFVHYEKGEWDAARAKLTEVTGKYPRSTAARLAEQRLQKLKAEGH
ncbi:tol-pal system protein YbgF [Endothiovibrio diazotrophicus]